MNNSSLIDFHARRFPWSLDRLFPIVIVISIFGYEYSTFIWLTFLRLLYNYPLTGLLVGLELHFFMVLMVASYYKCISVSPGTIPLDINAHFGNLESIRDHAKKLTVHKVMQNKSISKETILQNLGLSQDDDLEEFAGNNFDIVHELQQVSYCFKCNVVKFPRTHHCKICKMCVVRMDHHCPWIGNCVGLFNHKFFVLFLIYASICLLNIPLISLIYYIKDGESYTEGYDATEITSLQINGVTCFALLLAVGFLGAFQITVTLRNLTTVENHVKELKTSNPFLKSSVYENIADIFGPDVSRWWLPVAPRSLPLENEMLFITNGQSSYAHNDI